MTVVYLKLHDLDADQVSEEELDTLLHDDERRRAARFVGATHRRRFRVGRALLRRTLASWTGRSANSIVFEYGRSGKPAMRGGPTFNVSHSESSVLIGVASHGRLGVDIEVVRPIPDLRALAAANFAPDEVRELERTSGAAQDQAFLQIWTCKEAFLKARGDGLSIPLRSFCVAPSRAGNLLGEHDWSVRTIPISAAQVVAAFAIDARDCEIAWLPPSQ